MRNGDDLKDFMSCAAVAAGVAAGSNLELRALAILDCMGLSGRTNDVGKRTCWGGVVGYFFGSFLVSCFLFLLRTLLARCWGHTPESS